jgi:uncharacterized membrane protein YhaH (DUF805 family)
MDCRSPDHSLCAICVAARRERGVIEKKGAVRNMNPTMQFLIDAGLVAILSTSLVTYVKGHLQNLLVELCGTAERASFWLAFSNVTLVLVPLICALDYRPEFGPDRNSVFEMATQLEHAIIGFVTALSSLAIILFRFIPRDKPNTASRSSR